MMHAHCPRILLVFASALVLGAASAQAAMVVSNDATKNVSCAAGVCTATARFAVLNAGELTDMLASSDLTLQSGVLARDIILRTAFSWTGANRLTLDSRRSIIVSEPMTVAGSGALTLNTHGRGKALSFVSNGRIAFWDTSSSLIIDGRSYKLANSLSSLAGNIAADPEGRHALANNYDASVDGIYADSPIGAAFNGTVEGLGNTISNLTIRGGRRNFPIGLFAEVYFDGVVRDLALVDETVDGLFGSSVGGVTGDNLGLISHVFVRGTMSGGGDSTVGGLVGANEGTVLSSHSAGRVEARYGSQVGGLIGFQIVASFFGQTIASHSTAKVVSRGGDSYAGGLIGLQVGPVTQSWASGEVIVGDDDGNDNPPTSAGGLVGYFFADHPGSGTIANSYATGAVHGGARSHVGGLVGHTFALRKSNGPIVDSYSTGAVGGGADSIIGGLIGFESTKANTDTYWDLDTSGVSDPSRGAGNVADDRDIRGLADAQLKSGLPAGFDPAIWAQSPAINGGYPYLIVNPPPP